jgi:hypothetical protein
MEFYFLHRREQTLSAMGMSQVIPQPLGEHNEDDHSSCPSLLILINKTISLARFKEALPNFLNAEKK